MNTAHKLRERVSVNALNWVTLLGCAALATAAFRLSAAPPPQHMAPAQSPLADLPAGAQLEAVVNLARLRQSPLGAALAGQGRTLPGIGRLEDVCGFDPSQQIRSLGVTVVSVPNAQTPDFGVAAIGDFSAQRISACARAVIRRRGGVPLQTHLGSFLAVRDKRGHGGEIAVRNGGPVLLGAGRYLLSMIAAADGRAPAAQSDALQAALQRAVGGPRGALVVSAVLPAGWVERLAGAQLGRAAPLSEVRAVALRLDLKPGVEVHALVGCSAQPSCVAARRLLDRLVAHWLEPRLERAIGRRLTHPIRVHAALRQVRVDVVLTQAEAALLLGVLTADLGVSSRASAAARDAAPD